MGQWSSKKRRGRPKVARTPHDYGNDRVQERANMFRQFRGESSIGHEMSCAGRLMLVGAFDGMSEPAESILSALLEYGNGYWSYYGGGPQIATYERQDRSHDSKWEDPRGERFDAMDERLRGAGRSARVAVQSITTDVHWFPDENPAWADAIINRRFLDKGLPVAGEIATNGHEAWAMLDLLRLGALALVGQGLRRAA